MRTCFAKLCCGGLTLKYNSFGNNIHFRRLSQQVELKRQPPLESSGSKTSTGTRTATHVYKSICPWKSKEELASYLCDNILHETGGVIAINKPSGVGVLNNIKRRAVQREEIINQGKPDPKGSEVLTSLYHSRGVSTSEYTLEELVPLLRVMLDVPELQLVKSPERYASGVAIFGVNERQAQKLQHCIKITKAGKIRTSNYLVVSTNIPKIRGGILEERVGISLKENEATRRKQPVIDKDFTKQSMYNCVTYPANVELKLISSNPKLGVSTTEIRTDITRWNFLRVYSAYHLMPILGDQLYSARVQSVMGVKVALPPLSLEPGATSQKLSDEVTSALKLRTAEDSLMVPLHAHLHTYTLRGIASKKSVLVIGAPPPDFFQWTCSKLGLNLK